jgi:hypothetical protein
MKKTVVLLMVMFTMIVQGFSSVLPDEGMWLPMFVERLNYTDMQAKGLQLTPEELYSINHSSLKDAIVGLSHGPTPRGYFCTGEIVSSQGLIFTNHHCGFDAVQNHSSLEHDYLKDGFWAYSKDEELENEGLTASVLVRMENVTDSIFPFFTESMSYAERKELIHTISARIEQRNSENGKYNPVIKGFYNDNEFYMFVYQVYKDVRLVGAPPSAIGKFGGDTDNWMWPRHTGDFTIFRIYTAPDGSPAEYSKNNIPLKPKHHLPIAKTERKKNDFAMIWGFPGSTDRYKTSYGVDYNIQHFGPTIVDVLGKKLEVYNKHMDADPEVRIKYASKKASTSNGWKYYIGQIRGLKRLHVTDKKRKIEEAYKAWAKMQSNSTKYVDALENIQLAYEELSKTVKPLYYARLGLTSPELFDFVNSFHQGLAPYIKESKKGKKYLDAIPQDAKEEIEKNIDNILGEYDIDLDKDLMNSMLTYYMQQVESADIIPEVLKIYNKNKGNFNKFINNLYRKSIFASKEKMMAFLASPSYKKLKNDPAVKFQNAINRSLANTMITYRTATQLLENAKHIYLSGLRQMDPKSVPYPNANSTLRMTYGSVLDYYPADAVHYDLLTHGSGILEKEDNSNPEFVVPAKLHKLLVNKDFGSYANADGTLPVCFLTNNDITGGNSGSPTINGKGELMGLAFDGNWEAMSGDIAFEPQLQRTIVVDVRYVLFIIDKFAGAHNLIEEMDIRTE